MTRIARALVLWVALLTGGPATGADGHFLVILVAAAHLDYGDPQRLLRQLHKRSQLKQGFMGHSWVYLEGREAGRRQVVEAGLSPKGEGATRLVRGVLDLVRYGYVDPTEAQRLSPRAEPNPIAYLWRDHGNGYLQPASEVRLRPTYGARVDLDRTRYGAIRAALDPSRPSHRSFQLTGRQCTSFAAEVAAMAGIELEHRVTIEIPSEFRVAGSVYRLWTDPAYSRITLSSPDVLERSLKTLVAEGRAQAALEWYLGER